MRDEPTYTSRRIFKTAVTSQNVVREVLQLMFVSEFLTRGEEVWLVSPWISNIVLLDNRAGGFDAINPEWRRREIRLVDVAIQILSSGGRVTVVSRPDEHNKRFLFRLGEAAREAGSAISSPDRARSPAHEGHTDRARTAVGLDEYYVQRAGIE